MADQGFSSPRRYGVPFASTTVGANPPTFHRHQVRGVPTHETSVSRAMSRSRSLASKEVAGPILVDLFETLTLSETFSDGIYISETLTLAESLQVSLFFRPSLAETLTLSVVTNSGSSFIQEVTDSLTLSEGSGDAVGFDLGRMFGLSRRMGVAGASQHGDTLSFGGKYGKPSGYVMDIKPDVLASLNRYRTSSPRVSNYLVQLDEALFLEEAGRNDYSGKIVLSENFSLSENLGNPSVYSQPVTATLFFLENVSQSQSAALTVTDTLTLSETVFAASSQVTPITGTRIRVTFAQLMKSYGLKDTSRYTILPLDGGVPVAVSEVTPLRNTLSTGTVVTYPDPQPFTNVVNVGAAGIKPGTLFFLRGRWQDVEATVVSVSGSELTLDRPVTTGDPGPLQWELSEPYYGVDLIVTGTTRGKSYRLSLGPFLPAVSITPYLQSSVFLGLGDGYSVVSIEVLPLDLTLRVVLSDPLSLDLLIPSAYLIQGPTRAEVVGVRMENPTTLILTTQGLAAGNYILTLPLLKDQAQNISLT